MKGNPGQDRKLGTRLGRLRPRGPSRPDDDGPGRRRTGDLAPEEVSQTLGADEGVDDTREVGPPATQGQVLATQG